MAGKTAPIGGKTEWPLTKKKSAFSRFEVAQNDSLNKLRGKYSRYHAHSQQITNTPKDIKAVSSAI